VAVALVELQAAMAVSFRTRVEVSPAPVNKVEDWSCHSKPPTIET